MSEQDPKSPLREENPEQKNAAEPNSPETRKEQLPAELHFPDTEREHEAEPVQADKPDGESIDEGNEAEEASVEPVDTDSHDETPEEAPEEVTEHTSEGDVQPPETVAETGTGSDEQEHDEAPEMPAANQEKPESEGAAEEFRENEPDKSQPASSGEVVPEEGVRPSEQSLAEASEEATEIQEPAEADAAMNVEEPETTPADVVDEEEAANAQDESLEKNPEHEEVPGNPGERISEGPEVPPEEESTEEISDDGGEEPQIEHGEPEAESEQSAEESVESVGQENDTEKSEGETVPDEIQTLPGMVVPPAVASPGVLVPGLTGAAENSSEEETPEQENTAEETPAGQPETVAETPQEEIPEEAGEVRDEGEINTEERQKPMESTPAEELNGEAAAAEETEDDTQSPGERPAEEESPVEEAAEQEEVSDQVIDEPGENTLEGLEEIVSEEDGGDEVPEVREEVVDDLAHIIESIIFASDEPLPVATIKSVLDAAHTFGRVNPDMITARIGALNAKYESDGTGFNIVEIANGFQYATRRENAQWVSYLFKERSKRRLSNSALETVAIIAYKQPITKPEIESIRGVNVDYVLHNLLEKELVTVTGRAETVGRPLLYGTTQKFLKIFALKSLDDLPKLREIDEIIKEIKSKGAEESIQLEITALGDSSPADPDAEGNNNSGGSPENGAE